MEIYVQERTKAQQDYYDSFKERPDDVGNIGDYYLSRRDLFRNLHPFQFIVPESCCIQVGFHGGYIDLGVSQPLIIASILGKDGNLIAIEPRADDARSLSWVLENKFPYSLTEVINTTVWNKNGKVRLMMFDDFSSSDIVCDVYSDIEEEVKHKLWSQSRMESKTSVVEVQASKLDDIINIEDPWDFINITANGAEPAIIVGSLKLIEKWKPDIAFPLQNVRTEDLEYLCGLDYTIAIADAPHKPWEKKPFWYCVATIDHDNVERLGFKKFTEDIEKFEIGKYAMKEIK